MNRSNIDIRKIKNLLKSLAHMVGELLKLLFVEIRKLYFRFIERLRFSLTFKITWVYAHKTFSILFFLSLIITAGFGAYSGWSAQGQMRRDFNLVKGYLGEEAGAGEERIKTLAKLDNLVISIFDGEGRVIYTTDESAAYYDKVKVLHEINDGFAVARDYAAPNYNLRNALEKGEGSFGYVMVFREQVQWNNQNTQIQIVNRMARESANLVILDILLLIIDGMLILSVISSGARSSRRILKPIEVMTKTVENITINELDTRLDVRGSQDELKDLARTFNSMLDRLQQSYEQQNQFVSDASHELRTPISVIQGYAGLLDRWGKNDQQVLDEAISAIKTESENMKELVEKLLFLARGDKNTQKVEKADFNLNELIDEIIKETRMIDDGHEIIQGRNDEISINADRRLLKEALRIFVDNSIKYTPKAGSIKIGSFRAEGGVNISIEDTGVGISKEDLPHIFDRFYRADKARTRESGGTGLGLSIAKWIIQKHNGKIDVQSEVNVGTRIVISLPQPNNAQK